MGKAKVLGKLAKKLLEARRTGRALEKTARIETSFMPKYSAAEVRPDWPFGQSRQIVVSPLGVPARRQVYKKELLSLAEHGRSTEGETIFFAHPLQTLARRSKSRAESELMSIPPSRQMLRREDRPVALREMIKARRYRKFVKKHTKEPSQGGF